MSRRSITAAPAGGDAALALVLASPPPVALPRGRGALATGASLPSLSLSLLRVLFLRLACALLAAAAGWACMPCGINGLGAEAQCKQSTVRLAISPQTARVQPASSH